MSMRQLHDLSRVYLEKVASSVDESAKPDYLDFDKDGNKKESMKKALKDRKKVEEAIDPKGAARMDAAKGKKVETQDERHKRLMLGKYSPSVLYAKKKVEESKKPNDGNLANNYPPYDKVTRGDVIAGATGKDQMGGKKKVKSESFSNWRQDLSEVMDKISPDKEDEKEIKEKTVKNKVVINPDFKEAVEELGGQLIEMVEIDEKTLTPAETKKKEEIVMSMKKKGDFSKYGKRAKEVMYATATKQAKKLAEADMPQETQPSEKRAQTQQKQRLLQILQQKERAVRSGMTDISASYEVEGDLVDESRASERRGMGSPETRQQGYLVSSRKPRKEKGEKGGRHFYSGGQGGAALERGTKKGGESSQQSRLNPPEKSGKYAEMQKKKRNLGSRFD